MRCKVSRSNTFFKSSLQSEDMFLGQFILMFKIFSNISATDLVPFEKGL